MRSGRGGRDAGGGTRLSDVSSEKEEEHKVKRGDDIVCSQCRGDGIRMRRGRLGDGDVIDCAADVACAKCSGDFPSVGRTEKCGEGDKFPGDESAEDCGSGPDDENEDETCGVLKDTAEICAEEEEWDCEGD